MSRTWWISPYSQIILVALMCFCTVGIFNVMLSIGSNGLDSTLGNTSTVAVNTLFIFSGLLGGSVVNLLGPRLSLGISSLGYCFYAVSFYIYHKTGAWWPIILGGCILGLCAGVLWSAQGQIMLSYPTEGQKGLYVSIFWMIFNLGSVLGGFIPFGLNYDNKEAGVTPVTYLGLGAVMLFGSSISFLLAPIQDVIKDDGRPVLIHRYKSVGREAAAVFSMIKDWKMLCLLPLFLSSNWFYSYQFQVFNAEVFAIRTRSLNTVFYWFAQMVGALFLGKFLDNTRLNRSRKGLYAMIFIFVTSTCIWAGGLAFQLSYSIENNPYKTTKIDFTSKEWGPLLILYILYGVMDSMIQTLAYWVLGSLDNDPLVLSRYAGFYKAVQSGGAAISWGITTTDTPYLTQLLICWGIFEFSIPGLFLVIRSIRDTNVEYSYEHHNHTKL
ncbi:hypothetical protein K502DRAFT_300049 [Neoconidiobolus thromboides FSU 785]|nr:hypothetical protein K502DRAFT_300049 [Neoconidiobolus thromboides FSU 785]